MAEAFEDHRSKAKMEEALEAYHIISPRSHRDHHRAVSRKYQTKNLRKYFRTWHWATTAASRRHLQPA